MTIEIEINNNRQLVDQFTFSGGEVQVRIDPLYDYITDEIKIIAKIRSSSDLMALFLTWDAVKYRSNEITKFILELKYFPYARQDRRCQKGESSSMSVVCQMLNMMKFDEVIVWDIHNEKTLPLINNVTHVNQYAILEHSTLLNDADYDFIVAPDNGAIPKIAKMGISQERIITGKKVRDMTTGEITHTEITYSISSNLKGSTVLIVDDICDGGRTFIELAKVLKLEGVVKIDLFVTHGIFSKGLQVFDDNIDKIYTTDSFYENSDNRVSILKQEEVTS